MNACVVPSGTFRVCWKAVEALRAGSSPLSICTNTIRGKKFLLFLHSSEVKLNCFTGIKMELGSERDVRVNLICYDISSILKKWYPHLVVFVFIYLILNV